MNSENDDPIICRCEELRRSEIIEAVRAGARDLEAVKRRTRAGMGLCQGQSCGRLIARIIAEETGTPFSDIPPMRRRQPVNPVTLGELASGAAQESVKVRYLNILRGDAGVKEETVSLKRGSSVAELLEKISLLHGEALAARILPKEEKGGINPLLRVSRDGAHLFSSPEETVTAGSTYEIFIATFGG